MEQFGRALQIVTIILLIFTPDIIAATYAALSGLFQGAIIDSHVDNTDCTSNSCNIRSESLRSSCGQWATLDCLGHVYGGEVISCTDIGRELEICNVMPTSPRQYEWIKLSNNSVFGGTGDRCARYLQKKTASSVSVKLAIFYSKIFYCTYCLCTFSATEWKLSSTRAISFLWQRAKVSDNKVITGVQFIEKDGLIHLQAKQGTLLPNGRVSDEAWIPIDGFELETVNSPYTVYDERSSKPITIDRTVTSLYYLPKGDHRRQLHRHEHYAVLSLNLRTLNLNDVVAPQDHVITGIRLRFVKNIADIEDISNPNTQIELEVEAVPFDYKTGKITLSSTNPTKHYRGSEVIPESAKRTEVLLDEPDNPLRASENTLSTEPYQFVNFQVSSYRKDLAQATVPFFDTQPVESNPGAALKGVGIKYKGQKGFGGFIVLTIIPHDVA